MSQLHELAFWIGLCLILSLCLIALSAAHLLRDQPTAQRPARRTPVAGTVDELKGDALTVNAMTG